MSRIPYCLTAVLFAAVMTSGPTVAQTPAPPPATKAAPAPTVSKPTTAAQIEAWTTKQWEAAKKEWARDKAKWADCRKQSDKRKLEGRKSWWFLYQCMTS